MQVFLLHTYYHNNYLLISDFTTGKVKILRNYSIVVVISKYLWYKIIENFLSYANLVNLGKNIPSIY